MSSLFQSEVEKSWVYKTPEELLFEIIHEGS